MRLNEIDIHDIGTTTQIAGVVYHDAKTGQYIVIPFPGEGDGFPDGIRDGLAGNMDVLDMNLEEWERFIQQTDRVEVMAAVKDAHGNVGRAMVRKSARQISQNVSWAVYRRDHYRCRYCGTNEVPLTVDHLVLWEEGGPSIEANLVTACKKCNRMRGNLDYAVWLRHPYYREVSAKLPVMIQEQNERLAHTLAAIPRHPLKGKRKR